MLLYHKRKDKNHLTMSLNFYNSFLSYFLIKFNFTCKSYKMRLDCLQKGQRRSSIKIENLFSLIYYFYVNARYLTLQNKQLLQTENGLKYVQEFFSKQVYQSLVVSLTIYGYGLYMIIYFPPCSFPSTLAHSLGRESFIYSLKIHWLCKSSFAL